MNHSVALRWIAQAEERSVREQVATQRSPSEPHVSLAYAASGRSWPDRVRQLAMSQRLERELRDYGIGAQILLDLGVKDMILSGGENIASAEIERVLSLHPAVLECAVIAVPDDKWGEVPKALVVIREGQTADETNMLDHCRNHLAGFKVPKSVEFFPSLPKGGTGKIQKKLLREPYWAGRERRVQ